jgi:hypothetical protein
MEALRDVVTMACVQIRSADLAKLPVHVKRRMKNGGSEIIKNHAVERCCVAEFLADQVRVFRDDAGLLPAQVERLRADQEERPRRAGGDDPGQSRSGLPL